MASIYPIRFVSQMREHLRALRKKQGLTQAQLGAQLGVSQARIAEIEANPGLVSFEQLLKLLSHLESGFLLETGEPVLRPQLGPDSHVTGTVVDEVKAHVEDDEREELLHPDANKADTEREGYSFHKKEGSW